MDIVVDNCTDEQIEAADLFRLIDVAAIPQFTGQCQWYDSRLVSSSRVCEKLYSGWEDRWTNGMCGEVTMWLMREVAARDVSNGFLERVRPCE